MKMTKKGTAERIKLSKTERQYVRGIIHNLSFQRWTSQEIADYLHEEKGLDIARITVNRIRNQVERQAEKWYIELRESRYKYIAIYKERIDSLFSYQKKLHEIIKATDKPEVKIRAISELHSIEMDIFSLWKQLPVLQIQDNRETFKDEYNRHDYSDIPLVGGEDEEKHERETYFGWKEGDPPLDNNFRARMEEKYGVDKEPWDEPSWLKCSRCERWFQTRETLYAHTCLPKPIV